MSDWIIKLIEDAGYLGVGFLMFLETVFPPIPSEVIMTVSGLAAARGKMDITAFIAAGTSGAMLGNYFWYLALDWHEIEKAEKLFGTQGWAIVFFGRMLPTLRSLISIPAGLLHMRLMTFVIWSTIGTAGWTALLGLAGYSMGKTFKEVDNFVGPIAIAVMVVIVLGYVWRLITWKPDKS